MKRLYEHYIVDDLKKKMVFIGGPRQVGKTTLSKQLCQHYKKTAYFNWDNDQDRRAILNKQWHAECQLIVLDELHKYPKWKQWIKGVYDTKLNHQQFIVTGSARLDVYRRGGDSLLGRYHYWRLHPLTLDEIPKTMQPSVAYDRLMTVGGFPEVFLTGDKREARRWRRERFDRILREDIRDLDNIRNIQLLHLLIDALRQRTGQLITLSNIARDLDIAPKTVKTWLNLIENMYIGFSIRPYTKNIARSIQKPPKVYFYDNADTLSNEAARLENLVATTLLKRLHFLEDYEGYRCQLHYIRDKEGREVDFAVVINNQLTELIEVKLNDATLSKNLNYYCNKLKPKRAIQIVGNLTRAYHQEGILITNPTELWGNGQ